MTVLIQIQSQVQMTVQMRSIKDAIAYGLRKASYKDVQEDQQRGLLLWKGCVFCFSFCTLTAHDDTHAMTHMRRQERDANNSPQNDVT